MKKIYQKISLVLIASTLSFQVHAQCATQATLGSATNMVGLLRNNSSAIAANKVLNTITFIHRNNVGVFGGNSGQLRFDVSTNAGTTWSLDLGSITPISSNPARYPNIAIYNPVANTNTANAYINYMAPTISTVTSTFNGDVTGRALLNGTSPTETYNQGGIGTTLLPASLVPGAPGVFWAIEPLLSPLGFNIYKGVWNSSINDVVWAINYAATPSFINLPTTVYADYNIAFDPTGNIGYFSFTGHLTAGPADPTLYPILYKTTDGGTTWTGPIVVDVTKFSCVTSNTVSPNYPSINTGHDLVVDVNGNPHFITTLGNSSSYIFNYTLWQHMFDITMKNGVWIAHDLGNVNTAEVFVGAGATTFPQAHAPQASRSADGTKVFATWLDNASATLGSPNTTPDLFGKAYNVTNNSWTQTKNFTACNAALAGKMLFPHIAAEALEPNSTTYMVPAMYGLPTVTNNLDQPADFRYLNNISFSTSEFSVVVPAATVTIQQGNSLIFCPSSTVNVSVNGAGQVLWSNGSTLIPMPITTASITTYTVAAQVGCLAGTATLSVNTLTTNAAALTQSVCPGNPATFTVLGNALSYAWAPGTSTGTNVVLNPTSNAVTLTAMGSASCTVTSTVPLNILPQPNISIAGNNTTCAGYLHTQTANGGVTYLWSDNTVGGTFTMVATSNTVITVIGVGLNTCTNTATVSIVVNPSPVINATSSQSAVCAGQTVSLLGSGTPANTTYSWNNVSTGPNLVVTPATSTVYTLAGANSFSCISTKTVAVAVFALPTLSVTQSRASVCKNEKVVLTASGASSYTWVTQGALNASVAVTPTVAQTYSYVVNMMSSDGCTNSGTHLLVVNACTGLNELNAANAITVYPNPNNGIFYVSSETNMELTLTNELGQTVKHISLNSANGKSTSIENLAPGVYFIVGQNESGVIRQKIISNK